MSNEGPPAAIPFLDLNAAHAPLRDKLLGVLAKALDTGQFVGGDQVGGFEEDFAAYTRTCQAVGVASGTDALRLALLAMGIQPGRTVVTVPNTFIATAEAITQSGARLALVDVDPRTSLMDPNRLEDFLKASLDKGPRESRPAAVVPVHLYGQCADMAAIGQLASRYDLMVLEDAAQAHGAAQLGRPAGGLAQAAAFSFYPGKNLGALGEAGAVTTNDEEVARKVRMLRDHGQRQRYHHEAEGFNARLDAIQAGFLRVKLPSLEEWNQARRCWADYYDQQLGALGWLRPVTVLPHNLPSRHLYVVHAPQRDALLAHLAAQGINCGLHYPLPLHLQPCYARLGLGPGSLPVSEQLAQELISLPLFPQLGLERAQRVVEAVAAFGRAQGLA